MDIGDEFGRIGQTSVRAVTIRNAGGLSARIISFGARLVELHLPDRDEQSGDVVLGCDTLAEYLASEHYFGATCGRYGNRIAGGRFVLDGQAHQLDRNEGRNHLHGGSDGLDRKIWTIDALSASRVTLTATSEAGEMGYPGACALRSSYELTAGSELLITMEARSTAPTPMNMVHHSYFNLAGQGTGDIRGHVMRLNSRFYTPVDDALLATGEVLRVAGTPFDFRDPKPIGQDIDALPAVAVADRAGGGYDHNWCLSDAGVAMRDVADLYDPGSGRRMRLRSTEPGVQIYTGGYLTDRVAAKRGRRMCKYAGLTFETQKFPGAPNHAHFPDCILRPGQTYRHQMAFAFSAD